ncbi:hypothetical protein ABZX65_26735 [Streptomyces sp. NPDC003300]|uniref:hypothetical protein n=1 Tax=unclassified Streptomyces TaxID=2593676 RepID=UPI0033AD1D2B
MNLDAFRATGASLMVDRLGAGIRAALEAGARLQRYFLAAEAVGVPREVALGILHEAQGDRAGSTPTPGDLEAARERVLAHALSGSVPMSDNLRATVAHLAATTQYSQADLTAAVETLRGLNDPWPDERINDTLPAVTRMAAGTPYRSVDVAHMIRQVTT